MRDAACGSCPEPDGSRHTAPSHCALGPTARLVSVRLGGEAVFQVFALDSGVPALGAVTDSVSLTLRPSDVVTDGDVRAAWGLIDAMRVYVMAVEAARDRQTAVGPARVVGS
jgi:hypothetical protein